MSDISTRFRQEGDVRRSSRSDARRRAGVRQGGLHQDKDQGSQGPEGSQGSQGQGQALVGRLARGGLADRREPQLPHRWPSRRGRLRRPGGSERAPGKLRSPLLRRRRGCRPPLSRQRQAVDVGLPPAQRTTAAPCLAADLGELVFQLEKAIIVALQECRPELLFLHAAALERDRRRLALCRRIGCRQVDHGLGTAAPRLQLSERRACADRSRHARGSPLPARTLSQAAAAGAVSAPAPSPLTSEGRSMYRRDPFRAFPGSIACALQAVFFVSQDARRRDPVLQPREHGRGGRQAVRVDAERPGSRGSRPRRRAPGGGSASCFVLQAGDLERTCELIAATDV